MEDWSFTAIASTEHCQIFIEKYFFEEHILGTHSKITERKIFKH